MIWTGSPPPDDPEDALPEFPLPPDVLFEEPPDELQAATSATAATADAVATKRRWWNTRVSFA
jgi:hypothetical protein